MAASSFTLLLHAGQSNPRHSIAHASRPKQTFRCHSYLSAGDGGRKEEQSDGTKQGKRWPISLVKIYGEAGKLGRELKDCLSPKQKGDWKDLVLMSFSFAVYIYISQRIVCAYCAWMSMISRP
ncbi:hypothetical protein ZIOFF_027680 [Zingiber officinale]|uniref:Uncharacterized protein n=1 Tax=Zingiber officinale TaxID=94328 RepID=A0A8J5L2Y7_ZINOF|nr:hypothetical protein ZIOFF_027680 [Zingiber officinale]